MIATSDRFERSLGIWEALGNFISQLEASGRSPHTRDQLFRHVSLFGMWIDAQELVDDLTQITPGDVYEFMCVPFVCTRPDGKPKKESSMNALRSSLRSFFGFLHESAAISENPARFLKRAICSSSPPRGLTPDEEKRLLETLRCHDGSIARRDRALISTMLFGGLRVGAAVRLQVADVNFESNELFLRHTKGGRSDYSVMGDRLARELAEYLRDTGQEEGPLFPAKHGGELSTRHVGRVLSAWLKKAGINRSHSPHSLRRTCACRAYARTGDPFVVKEVLRHRSLASTLMYVSTDKDRVRRALE